MQVGNSVRTMQVRNGPKIRVRTEFWTCIACLPLANRASTTVFDFKRGELFFFARGRPEFFFTERASPRAFFFSVEGASSSFFRAKPYPNPQKFSGLRPPSGATGLVLTLNGAAGWLWGV